MPLRGTPRPPHSKRHLHRWVPRCSSTGTQRWQSGRRATSLARHPVTAARQGPGIAGPQRVPRWPPAAPAGAPSPTRRGPAAPRLCGPRAARCAALEGRSKVAAALRTSRAAASRSTASSPCQGFAAARPASRPLTQRAAALGRFVGARGQKAPRKGVGLFAPSACAPLPQRGTLRRAVGRGLRSSPPALRSAPSRAGGTLGSSGTALPLHLAGPAGLRILTARAWSQSRFASLLPVAHSRGPTGDAVQSGGALKPDPQGGLLLVLIL